MAAASAAKDARARAGQGGRASELSSCCGDGKLTVFSRQAEVSSLQAQLRHSSNLNASPDPNATSPVRPAWAEATTQARLRTAEAKVATLERRLAATQEQLREAETRLAEQRTKYGAAEGKWEARVRELEQRVRAAEEKVKRERQGAKERVAELEQDAR